MKDSKIKLYLLVSILCFYHSICYAYDITALRAPMGFSSQDSSLSQDFKNKLIARRTVMEIRKLFKLKNDTTVVINIKSLSNKDLFEAFIKELEFLDKLKSKGSYKGDIWIIGNTKKNDYAERLKKTSLKYSDILSFYEDERLYLKALDKQNPKRTIFKILTLNGPIVVSVNRQNIKDKDPCSFKILYMTSEILEEILYHTYDRHNHYDSRGFVHRHIIIDKLLSKGFSKRDAAIILHDLMLLGVITPVKNLYEFRHGLTKEFLKKHDLAKELIDKICDFHDINLLEQHELELLKKLNIVKYVREQGYIFKVYIEKKDLLLLPKKIKKILNSGSLTKLLRNGKITEPQIVEIKYELAKSLVHELSDEKINYMLHTKLMLPHTLPDIFDRYHKKFPEVKSHDLWSEVHNLRHYIKASHLSVETFGKDKGYLEALKWWHMGNGIIPYEFGHEKGYRIDNLLLNYIKEGKIKISRVVLKGERFLRAEPVGLIRMIGFNANRLRQSI